MCDGYGEWDGWRVAVISCVEIGAQKSKSLRASIVREDYLMILIQAETLSPVTDVYKYLFQALYIPR
jgi:hypothetical protein